jgi:hypothetical protein
MQTGNASNNINEAYYKIDLYFLKHINIQT